MLQKLLCSRCTAVFPTVAANEIYKELGQRFRNRKPTTVEVTRSKTNYDLVLRILIEEKEF